jgi:hypothetical protein
MGWSESLTQCDDEETTSEDDDESEEATDLSDSDLARPL